VDPCTGEERTLVVRLAVDRVTVSKLLVGAPADHLAQFNRDGTWRSSRGLEENTLADERLLAVRAGQTACAASGT
jgi:hypothetical protein